MVAHLFIRTEPSIKWLLERLNFAQFLFLQVFPNSPAVLPRSGWPSKRGRQVRNPIINTIFKEQKQRSHHIDTIICQFLDSAVDLSLICTSLGCKYVSFFQYLVKKKEREANPTHPNDIFIRICCHLVFNQPKVLFLLGFVSFIGHSV